MLIDDARVCPRQKMQRYPHRAVPRASPDPTGPTANPGQRLGPLARPLLSRRLWKRVRQKHTTPPKDPKFCAARCVWPQKIRPHIGRAGGTGLAYRPSAVRTPLLKLPAQNSLHRGTGDTFLSAPSQLLSPLSIHPAGR